MPKVVKAFLQYFKKENQLNSILINVRRKALYKLIRRNL